MRLLRWVISQRILKKCQSAKIIVTGDFNDLAIKKLGFLEELGLKKVVEEGVATHAKGN